MAKAKSLIIVESPAKARTISKFLGKKYKVKASMGHIRDLPKSQLGINVEKNFKPKYITIRGKGPILNEIKKEAKKAENILLATDPDREGEAISWHLAHLLGLKDSPCRIEFNEITKNAVTNSIKSPRKIDENLVEAQQARRILDRLVGYKISPILWKKVRRGLSAGRVQSVAVKIICDREKEITEFKPEEYWSIDALLKDTKSDIQFEAKLNSVDGEKANIRNKSETDQIISDLSRETFVVSKVKKSNRRRNPSAPFTTSSMQQEASSKLGFTAKKTMVIAQQLYEGLDIKGKGTIGLITYIRTDSTRLSDQSLKQVRSYIDKSFGKEYVPSKPRKYKHKKGSQDAHEAIRPTSVDLTPDLIKSSLTIDQYKLYKLVWQRFVSCQMTPAVYDTISIDIKAGRYTFRATGSRLKFPGYLILYKNNKSDKKQEKNENLPELTIGQNIELIKLLPEQHFTQPPPRYTEAMLVKTLEEKGIGRPSTYAPTIDIIQRRGYVEKENGRFKPTELGGIVVKILKEYFGDIVDIDFTAEMEEQLDKIESGEQNRLNVLESFYSPFEKNLKVAEKELEKVEIKDEVTDEKCEICGKNMVVKHGRFGKFLACPGFPECKNTKPYIIKIGVPCPKCGGDVIVRRSKKGRTFYGCSNFPKCRFISWQKPSKNKCPRCGKFMVIKNKKSGKIEECSDKECGYKIEKS